MPGDDDQVVDLWFILFASVFSIFSNFSIFPVVEDVALVDTFALPAVVVLRYLVVGTDGHQFNEYSQLITIVPIAKKGVSSLEPTPSAAPSPFSFLLLAFAFLK